MPEIVELILEMRHVAEFVREAREAAGATEHIGKAAEKSGKQAAAGWKGIAKWAGAGVLLYGATRAISSVTEANVELAKSTLGVQRVTDMDTKTASEWVGVMKERNISVRTFQVGMKTLSKQMETSRLGTALEAQQVGKLRDQIDRAMTAGGPDAAKKIAKASAAIATVQTRGEKSRHALERLGVSFELIRKGKTNEVLLAVADGLRKIRNPAERVALTQQLLGRSGVQLLPILMKGRKGIEEQLEIQERYGNYLTGHGIKDTKAFIEKQRELNAAAEGAKVQLGSALQPALMAVAGALTDVANAMAPILKNGPLLRAIIFGFVDAFIAWKTAALAAWVAQTFFNTELAITGAILAPIIGIAVGVLIALAFGIYMLVKHWSGFVSLLKKTWGWIKKHWPLLLFVILGPFALVLPIIIKHWKAIEHATVVALHAVVKAMRYAWDWVKTHWPLLLAILLGPVTLATYLIVKNWRRILDGFAYVWHWVRTRWPQLADWLKHPFTVAADWVRDRFTDVRNALTGVWHTVKRIVDRIVNYIRGIPARTQHAFGGMVSGLIDAVPGGRTARHLFHKITPFANGGVMGHAGLALVGERGPELLALPRGAGVTPLPPTPIGAFGGAGAGAGRPIEVVIPVYLDGREVARSVARVTANQQARR